MKLKNLFIAFVASLMAVACTGNDDPGTGENEKGLIFKSSATYILNDGNDEALFTVTMDGQDVTAQSTIYQKVNGTSTAYSGYSFKSTETGKYVFFASYEGKLTSELTIEVVKEKLDLPEDVNPDKFDGFRKRVLLTEGTSLDCNICPRMIAGIQEFKKLNTNGDAIITVVHGVKGHDNFFTEATDIIANQMFSKGNINGVPATVVNMKINEAVGVMSSDTPESVANNIKKSVDNELLSEANSAISASVSGTNVKGISVSAKVKVKTAGKYLMTIWLVEDNLSDSKKQAGVTPDLDAKYDFDTHNNVVRYVSSTEPIYGTAMGGKETVGEKETLEFYHTISPDAFISNDMQNMRVVFIVNRANENSSQYVTDNVVECPLNQSIAFEYK